MCAGGFSNQTAWFHPALTGQSSSPGVEVAGEAESPELTPEARDCWHPAAARCAAHAISKPAAVKLSWHSYTFKPCRNEQHFHVLNIQTDSVYQIGLWNESRELSEHWRNNISGCYKANVKRQEISPPSAQTLKLQYIRLQTTNISCLLCVCVCLFCRRPFEIQRQKHHGKGSTATLQEVKEHASSCFEKHLSCFISLTQTQTPVSVLSVFKVLCMSVWLQGFAGLIVLFTACLFSCSWIKPHPIRSGLTVLPN